MQRSKGVHARLMLDDRMRGKVWICSFGFVLVLAIIIIFNPESDTFTGITIEMWGAFIGVFAAVSLGEIIKVFEDYRIALRVRKHLTSELRNILENAKKKSGTINEYGTNFWDSAITSGELSKLDDNLFLNFSVLYTKIHGHNRTARQCESMYNQPNATPENKQYYLETVIRSEVRLERLLETVLERIRTNQVEDITGFFS